MIENGLSSEGTNLTKYSVLTEVRLDLGAGQKVDEFYERKNENITTSLESLSVLKI